MRNRIARLGLGAALAIAVTAPMTSTAHAFVCSPTIRPACDTVCQAAGVCRLFG